MPKDRLPFQDIKSWTPSVDVRSIGEGTTFVLSGKNFAFDSKGPKSAFASRLLNNGTPIATATDRTFAVQSLGGFIFTPIQIGRFNSAGTFIPSYTYADPIAGEFVNRRWSRAVFGTDVYFCHPGVGLLRFNLQTNEWEVITPGIASPQAVIESNGRMIVLGSGDVAWSGPDDPEDFVPELGGAGAQEIRLRISGTPFALIALAQGYAVFTTQGILMGTYTGNDTVFKHDVAEHQHIPLSDSAITGLADGSYIVCTSQGLHLYPYSGAPQVLTPVFNEYLREELLRSAAGGYHVRLDYIAQEDRLYMQVRDWTNYYGRTYVLSVALDKWGIFSKEHFGIIRHSIDSEPFDGVTGYVDTRGRAHRFMMYGTNCESEPGVLESLDAEIILGPMRIPGLQPTADAEQELQGLVIGCKARPKWAVIPVEDLGTSSGDEDEQALPDSIEDLDTYNLRLPPYSYGVQAIGDMSGYDEIDSLDPDSENGSVIIETPEIIRDTGNVRHFAVLVPGVWHRIRITALNLDEYFHVTFGELTLSYSGRLNP